MAFTVDISIDRKLKVKCPYAFVFDTLADVPYSAGHFPKVDELVDLGNECYRWEMEKIGLDRYYIQTVYACEYTWDKEEGWIRWAPVDGVGNGRVEGQWDLKDVGGTHTQARLQTTGALTLPFPRLAKVIVAPLVEREFTGLVDEYIENLKQTWKEHGG